MLYWTAYTDLQHERPPARYVEGKPVAQRIPWSAIANYARFHGLNVDELKRVIWAIDAEFIGDVREPREENGHD